MPPLSMLIKPVSGNCNLRCKYCFYNRQHGVMTADMLELIVSKALNFADGFCAFTFQGGEPTLAGLPFYENLILLQQKYNLKGLQINNAIQTNGIMVNKQWADFFAKNNFLVGLSLDGSSGMHNKNRLFPDQSATFDKVMEATRILNEAGTSYNILAVVTEHNARQAAQMYRFFTKNGFEYLQFIPCLDSLDNTGKPFLTPQAYLYFLKTIFDLWLNDFKNGKAVSIRYFDNLLGMIMGYPPEACNMTGVCNCQFVIEADGSVYPCDFYVSQEHKIGSIIDESFEKMRFSQVCESFINDSRVIHDDCKICKWHNLCRGGCARERSSVNAAQGKNRFCPEIKSFFEYSLPGFIGLARYLERRLT